MTEQEAKKIGETLNKGIDYKPHKWRVRVHDDYIEFYKIRGSMIMGNSQLCDLFSSLTREQSNSASVWPYVRITFNKN